MHYDLYEFRAREDSGCYIERIVFRAVPVFVAVVLAGLRLVPFPVSRVLLFAFDHQLGALKWRIRQLTDLVEPFSILPIWPLRSL